MRLGFSAWAMPDLPVAAQIALVRDAGYTGIELVSAADGKLDALRADTAERRQIRHLLDEAHLTLSAVDGHANLLVSDPQRRAAAEARLRAGIDLAADLAGPEGAPCLVTMAFGRPDQYEEVRETVAERLGAAAAHAAARDVVLALEPHVGQAFDRPERVTWLLERVGSPHFRLNLDNSHFEVMGCQMDDYLPRLVPYAVHTHLKDQRGRRPDDYAFLVPGEGEFDYARYLAAMARAGYGGFITVEISKQVQKRLGYDPAEVAARSFETIAAAAARTGVALDGAPAATA